MGDAIADLTAHSPQKRGDDQHFSGSIRYGFHDRDLTSALSMSKLIAGTIVSETQLPIPNRERAAIERKRRKE